MKTTNIRANIGILNEKRATWHDNIMSAIVFAERGEAAIAREFLGQNKRAFRQKRKTDGKKVLERHSRRMYS